MQNLLPYLFGILAGLNVLLGGLLVLKFAKYFNTILGFAGGVMISIVGFEILPEILDLAQTEEKHLLVSVFFILGILLFHLLSRFFPLHEHGHHQEEIEHKHTEHHHKGLGIYGAIIMISHSFVDGLGIGFGFQSSVYIGLSVAMAVLAHNFSDGVNIISTLLHENFQKNAKKIKISLQNKILFILNIFAPLFGIIVSSFLTVSENFLLIYLSFFAGSILYLALSDILPQAHSDKHNKTPVFATLSAVLFIFLITYIGH